MITDKTIFSANVYNPSFFQLFSSICIDIFHTWSHTSSTPPPLSHLASFQKYPSYLIRAHNQWDKPYSVQNWVLRVKSDNFCTFFAFLFRDLPSFYCDELAFLFWCLGRFLRRRSLPLLRLCLPLTGRILGWRTISTFLERRLFQPKTSLTKRRKKIPKTTKSQLSWK